MAGDGRFVVAWQEDRDTYGRDEVWARRFDAAAQPQGLPFRVETSATAVTPRSTVAVAPDGRFTVVWASSGAEGWTVRGQRFDAGGARLGQEFAANTVTGNSQTDPTLAVDAAGNIVVAWTRGFGFGSPANGARVFARRFDAGGVPLGGEFRVNAYTSGHQIMPSVAFQDDGSFLVAWHSTQQDGSQEGVFAQRYSAAGAPVGGEVPVNSYTTGIQAFPCVGPAGNGGFVIAWISFDAVDDAGAGVFARRFDAAGNPLGPEFRVGYGMARLGQRACSLAKDARGGFAVAWDAGSPVAPWGVTRWAAYVRRYDAAGNAVGPTVALPVQADTERTTSTSLAGNGSGRLALASSLRTGSGDWDVGVAVRLLSAAWPLALSVGEASGGASDRNGVLDPGEAVVVAPTWQNVSASDLPLNGQAASFTGPGAPQNPQYLIFDATAGYGTLPSGAARGCAATGDCFVLGVSTPVPRPLQHMDATFVEQLSNQQSRAWTVHLGGSFDDVPRLDPFYRFAETLLHHNVSAGCSATSFCPGAVATREQMAVFLLVAKMGPFYTPPQPIKGVFDDVPASSPFAHWIEDLWNRGVVSGCGADQYCPSAPVTRAQMAAMLLRTLEGPSYVPPPCSTPVFADVPCSDPFARWVNELAARGITAGCGGGLYCPGSPVTRGQMAVFLSRTFGLELYGAGDVR